MIARPMSLNTRFNHVPSLNGPPVHHGCMPPNPPNPSISWKTESVLIVTGVWDRVEMRKEKSKARLTPQCGAETYDTPHVEK